MSKFSQRNSKMLRAYLTGHIEEKSVQSHRWQDDNIGWMLVDISMTKRRWDAFLYFCFCLYNVIYLYIGNCRRRIEKAATETQFKCDGRMLC